MLEKNILQATVCIAVSVQFCIVAMKHCGCYGYRYKRVFAIGTKAITTLNPNNHEITNQV